MSSRSDEPLRRVFRAVKAARKERPTPSFDGIVARRRPRRHRRRSAVRGLAVIVAGILAVAVALPLHRAHREREALEFVRELAAWKAPSDRLLETYAQFDGHEALFRGLGEPSVLEPTNEMVRWR